MAVTHDKPKHTIDDYMRLPEGERVELIDGELLVSPSPLICHQDAGAEIFVRMRAWAKERKLGKVFIAPTDVVLSRYDVVQPDILFISNERRSIVTKANVQGAPDLIAEVLSPGTRKRDLVAKKALYERHGVKEYWIVDPRGKMIEAFDLHDRKLVSRGVFSGAENLESSTMAGFTLPVEAVFREE